LCGKLAQCGLVQGFGQAECQLLARSLENEEAAKRVASGECHFDAAAADRCLGAIRAMPCNANFGADIPSWLLAADLVGECGDVFSCS
jgi:hypothetical protein